jgi:hypothetical protein
MGDTRYTVQEFLDAAVKAYSDTEYEDEGYVDWDDFAWGNPTESDIGPIRTVENEGGEGQGDHAHLVFETVRSGQLFRIDGYYSSYEGTDWDYESLREVKAVTREVVFYE